MTLIDSYWGTEFSFVIYNTENQIKDVKKLNGSIFLDEYTCITQLPNGELFCYGNRWDSGITLIIDRSYEIRMLPSGTKCHCSSALYFDNNIYCFGGYNHKGYLALSRKFDLKNNRWIDLKRLPEADWCCNSLIFNGNFLIYGYFCKTLWLYSIEIDSFSIIPLSVAGEYRKIMINAERLYLIEWGKGGIIFEGEDEYNWKPISNLGIFYSNFLQIYCLNNKEKIYISTDNYSFQFDLKEKL